MGAPAKPDVGVRRRFSGWELPVILLIALALRLQDRSGIDASNVDRKCPVFGN